ncbi:ParA family protein [Photobacterium lutimaris]|uniref:ParA family protein n=1 Tax=Photobacterium lutimaris TaxID=388278 RepID=A0A2T3ITU0_9GAMM|nr:ParA family protein [Photobacterium lutimaris]PSU31777.1 ParA family protein [Photobacterium lutimaris]TDR72570.1 cellulose biosynthesis protein BcsQ [Photobacterium lutimaris]
MQLAKYKFLSETAQKILKERTETSYYMRDDLKVRTYSQNDVQKLLKFTDKPYSRQKVSDAMEEMTAAGYEFSRAKNNNFQLTRDDVIAIGEYVGVTKYGDKTDGEAFVITMLNLKGGVGKSLATNMLSHALSYLCNYVMMQPRVLIIDLDPQGTSSQQNVPDYDVSDTEFTSINAMSVELTEEEILDSAVVSTEHPNLSIIKCTTDDGFTADQLHDEDVCDGAYVGSLLKTRLIDKVKDKFDIILLDVGPHLDNVLKNALWASDLLIAPVPPTFVNFDSSLRMMHRLYDVMEDLVENGLADEDLPEITAFLTKMPIDSKESTYDKDINEAASKELNLLFSGDGLSLLSKEMYHEDAYERCLELGHTIFAIQKSDYPGDGKAFNRALGSATKWATNIMDQIEIRHTQRTA